MADHAKHRLVTRSDFDGLVCAVLLQELELIDEIIFAHPKDVTDGTFEITGRDITTNLPYSKHAYLAFDHHASEQIRWGGQKADNHILDPEAPSAARVVYEYYGGRERFKTVSDEMMLAVDKCDSADFTRDEVVDPGGWVLLSFLMDPRTGLGRFRQFRIANYALMMQLIDSCRKLTIEEILATPDVAERVALYEEQSAAAQEQLRRCAALYDNLVVLDLRDEEVIHVCNRHLVYAAFPECNISMHVLWGKNKQNTVFALGNSILNRSSITNIGELCLRYGGGGHANAGTCQVDHADAERVLAELIEATTQSEHVPLIEIG